MEQQNLRITTTRADNFELTTTVAGNTIKTSFNDGQSRWDQSIVAGYVGPRGPVGPTGAQGLPGAPGPKGDDGIQPITVDFSFQTKWTHAHNLGRKPTVSVFSAGGLQVIAQVLHLSNDIVEISFDEPMSGYIILT